MKKVYLVATLIVIAAVVSQTGCASNASKRRVGVGVSKSPGQKARLNVNASRTVGKNGRGNVGASKQVEPK